jgi:DNA ligase 1
MITLYRKNALGIGSWSIWADGDTLHIVHSSTLDGATIHHEETISRGCQGRSIEEQVQSRIRSRISKQRDKGYVHDIDEAAKGAFNQLGLIPPMLAQVYGGSVGGRQAWLQRKLNGLRCLFTRQDGEVIAYSRRGKRLDNIHEIFAEVSQFLSEGDVFDGELYSHGTSLQTINSWVKRRQPMTGKIQYVIYDQVSKDSFSDRHDSLEDMLKGREFKRTLLLPKYRYIDEDTRSMTFDRAREKGFEGLMVRLDGFGYESNKRSASLLKDKAVFDTEVIVKDIVLSDKGNPVCVCVYEGKEFRTSPPGSRSDRQEAYANRLKYIGTRLTIEYREMTDDGIPFHAVGTAWRKD